MAFAQANPTAAAVVAKDVRFRVPAGPDVLAGIDLTIRDGEFVVIVGPSGCGKTTFLNMVAGLQGYTSGDLRVAGAPPKAGRRDTAYALARDALLPWRDALGNVELALQIRGIAPEERAKVVTRFYRLDRSRSLPGNGLGLAIVTAISHLHGGRLSLEDAAPGLIARIVLPRAAA